VNTDGFNLRTGIPQISSIFLVSHNFKNSACALCAEVSQKRRDHPFFLRLGRSAPEQRRGGETLKKIAARKVRIREQSAAAKFPHSAAPQRNSRIPPGSTVTRAAATVLLWGYSTNIPSADLLVGKAMVATKFDGQPFAPEHGGPAPLLLPHLYFWKSAKWVTALQFTERNEPGFWETRGYHEYGDPWLEQRYRSD
jgi:DMSO/TMAO reductase YedYZ molybdopterin-dependent catalytic subunit